MNILSRSMAVMLSHSHIVVRHTGDVYYDKDDNIVEIDEGVVQAYIDANGYKDRRKIAYPSFADQFDALYHGGYDAWKAMIQQIKDEIPKP
jgi:hypothetical protein